MQRHAHENKDFLFLEHLLMIMNFNNWCVGSKSLNGSGKQTLQLNYLVVQLNNLY